MSFCYLNIGSLYCHLIFYPILLFLLVYIPTTIDRSAVHLLSQRLKTSISTTYQRSEDYNYPRKIDKLGYSDCNYATRPRLYDNLTDTPNPCISWPISRAINNNINRSVDQIISNGGERLYGPSDKFAIVSLARQANTSKYTPRYARHWDIRIFRAAFAGYVEGHTWLGLIG